MDPSAAPASLESILITDALAERAPCLPDLQAEIDALHALARQMASRPDGLLNALVRAAVRLCRAGSAGVSLLERDADGKELFRWVALAGAYAGNEGGTTPRDFSPCGTCLDRGSPQLFSHPARRFTYFNAVSPPMVEGLVLPFGTEMPVYGTIWIASHDESRHFDSEDVRVMTGLADFAAAALRLSTTAEANAKLCRTLQEADRRKDGFLATLAHELRNPLAPVRNAVEVLRQKGPPEPELFSNLLNNAAKYSEPGGRIRLTAVREGSDTVVSVRDGGIGIPADKLPHVFEMYAQVETGSERSEGGLGIGLALAKQQVTLHGGSIEARSDGPGHGSEFVVRLPIDVAAQAPQDGGVKKAERGTASGLRILVVDDNRDAADSLGMLLRVTGNDPRTAYDGAEAVAVAGAFRPDVVLLDIGLPKLNGYEVDRCSRSSRSRRCCGWPSPPGCNCRSRRRTGDDGSDHSVVLAMARRIASFTPIGRTEKTSRAFLSRTTVGFFSPSIKCRPTS